MHENHGDQQKESSIVDTRADLIFHPLRKIQRLRNCILNES